MKKYFAPTPAHIKKLLLLFKAALTAMAGNEYMQGNPQRSFWILVALGVINEALNFTTEKPNEGL